MRTLLDGDMDMDPGGRDADRGMGRGVYRDTEPEPAQPVEQRDLTLGMTSLLGIFLAVVLVCAVFFGFGYSTGRVRQSGKPAPAQMAVAPPASSATSSGNAASRNATGEETGVPATTLTAAQPAAKPSAGAPLTAGPSAGQDAIAVQRSDEEPGFPDEPPARRAKTAVAPPVSTDTASPAMVTPSTVPPAGGGVMVQIAAVMHQADAEMLAQALRSNGYAAVVRTEPQDKFLHVQVGPFATRDQAKAMRTRLQGDGYNAFLKP